MKKALLVAFLGLACSSSFAQKSCADYEFMEETNVSYGKDGLKILSTGSVSVLMDDIDSIKDARQEATLEAKAMIAKFLTETIQKKENIEKVVNEAKFSDGETRTGTRQEAITRLTSISSNAQALLRGVVILGSCYTKAREYRVTVGLKPETIAAAGELAKNINNSVRSSPTPQPGQQAGSGSGSSGNASTGSTPASQGLRGTDGHSNSERARNF